VLAPDPAEDANPGRSGVLVSIVTVT